VAASLDLLDTSIRDAAKELVRQCGVAGLLPKVTSTLRSTQEQTRLYRAHLAGAGGYPVAPPGLSAHEYGLAFDLVVSPITYLPDVGAVWISWGGGWSPSDAVHFEYPGAETIAQQLFQAGVNNQEPWALKALDFLLGVVKGPWWSGFLPESVAGSPRQAYSAGAIGAILKDLGFL